VVVTGGEKVWPDPVEAVLADHPAVAEVAVAGVPDPEWGSRVVAWLVLRPGHPVPSAAELRGVVTERLPAYCAPKEIRIVDHLPRTALGKVQRHRLQGSGTPAGQ
jgi:O-succinylbenzoic acid--CoA ligase